MNADSLALESAYSIGKFFPIKEDSLHKLFFCGQDHPIAFWILYNKKQKKVESIKSDCFEEAAEDITVREKYNAALAILKKKLSHKFYYDEHMNPVPLIYDSLYINLYKADPPQWLIDSLQKDVSYEVLPKSKLETNGNFNVNKISVKSPLYVVDNFEIISCSTGVILFGIYKNHYNRYEMIKANGKWWTGETYDNGLSWINMREREKNIQNIFREERVHKPETRK